jgi:protein disulfide-isomerase A6
MKRSVLCIAALLFLGLTAVRASDEVDESDVVVLNAQTFDAKTADGVWMVEFYAPWCGHCKTLQPTWAQFATASKGKINVAKVDGSEERELAKRFGIRGFPTIKLIRDGKLYDFNLQRTVKDFTKFAEVAYAQVQAKEIPAAPAAPVPAEQIVGTAAVEAETGNAAKEVVILTEDNFDAETAAGDWLVEFYAPWCGHCKRLAPIWDQLAEQADESLRVGKVDCTTQNAVCSRFGVRGYPTIKLLRDGKPTDYSGGRTVEAFIAFHQKAKADSL